MKLHVEYDDFGAYIEVMINPESRLAGPYCPIYA